MLRTASTNSGGRSLAAEQLQESDVGIGPGLATRRARISVPSLSTTPTASPFFTRIRVTSELVRISAPASRAAEAMALLIPPMPPRT